MDNTQLFHLGALLITGLVGFGSVLVLARNELRKEREHLERRIAGKKWIQRINL